ncbi:hypothetical protein ABIA71_001575 [Stenotrophomonas sp. 2619]|uniref:hypothetical protein n=1 Tax=Stenotrophomonas sp. 2619 TaxID=3156316 RepID=UPI003394FECE
MHHGRVLVALLLSAAVLPFDTRAAASLLVDDATITDAHHCQLESWVRHTRDGQEWTAVPACTLADTEWSLGLTRLPGQPSPQWAVGAKRVLVERRQRRWGLAASAGLGGTAHPPRGDDWNLAVPLTVALDAQDKVQLHLNLGWARHAHVQGHTSGVGIEVALHHDWSLLAESARDADRQRSSQVGLRRVLWPGASVDLLAVQAHHLRDTRWLTLGFNLAALP